MSHLLKFFYIFVKIQDEISCTIYSELGEGEEDVCERKREAFFVYLERGRALHPKDDREGGVESKKLETEIEKGLSKCDLGTTRKRVEKERKKYDSKRKKRGEHMS